MPVVPVYSYSGRTLIYFLPYDTRRIRYSFDAVADGQKQCVGDLTRDRTVIESDSRYGET